MEDEAILGRLLALNGERAGAEMGKPLPARRSCAVPSPPRFRPTPAGRNDRMVERDAARPVTLFTQEGCPDSARVRACFRRSAVPFVERNVTGDAVAARALLATGTFATPVVLAGGRVLVGARLDRLAAALGFRCRCPGGGG
jgi:glutaredoxin